MPSNKEKPNDPKWEIQSLLDELSGENDRASAIVGAAWMDDIILSLLSTFMVPHKETDHLLGIKGRGPISNYWSRVITAFALGLITEEEKDNLEKIGNIRNLFAHRIHRSSFSNPKIRDYCYQLSIGKRFASSGDKASTREIFLATVSILAYSLNLRVEEVKSERCVVRRQNEKKFSN